MPRLSRKTRHLAIRPLKESDYLAWKTAHSTMLELKNFWDQKNRADSELSRAKFKALIHDQNRKRAQDEYYDFGVFLRATRAMIGRASVMNVQRGLGQSAYLGYAIFNRHWGRGFGKECVRALIDIAFRDCKVHRVEAGIEPENRRSIRLAQSLGLRKEGRKKRAVYLRKAWRDLLVYAATSEEFGIRWVAKIQSRLH